MAAAQKLRAVLIFGPTGVGKNSVATALARVLPGEIVNIDPQQAYRYFDIGTNKPTEQERAAVAHHLYDTIDPFAESGASSSDWFIGSVRSVVSAIHSRARVPIFVGGSHLYARFVNHGTSNVPQVDRASYERAYQEYRRMGWDRAFELLRQRDPDYAASLDANNWNRLIKGLSVVDMTGIPISSHPKTPLLPEHTALYHFDLVRPRLGLYRMLDRRCEDMLRAGLLSEAAHLLDRQTRAHGMPNPFAFKSIGYRHCVDFLDFLRRCNPNEQRDVVVAGFTAMLQRFQRDTRRLAREQMTCFRGRDGDRARYMYEQVSMDVTKPPEAAAQYIHQRMLQGVAQSPRLELSEEYQGTKGYEAVATMSKQEMHDCIYEQQQSPSFLSCSCWEWCRRRL
ncbi:hypothetical protein RI367_004808 [Sorochytrium milnesiophthora]